MPDNDHAPSAERRRRLKEREAKEGKNLMKVLDSFPIEKYYGMAERLLQAFEVAVDERRLDDAYVFGLRFATFGIESLPKHQHYNQAQFKRLKAKNARQVDQVLKKLESVSTRMDAEELRLARQRKEAVLAKQRAAEARQREESQRQQDQAAKRQHHEQILQQQREELRAHQKAEMEQRAMDKLRKLNQQPPQAPAPALQPRQERQPANTTSQLVAASTGQDPHTKDALSIQKARQAEEARLKLQQQQQQKEEEKREASQQETKLSSKKKVSQKKPKKATAPAKAKAPKTVKQPSKLDPNALAQVDQLKEEFAKQEVKPSTTVDYKAEFAKQQAEWNKKKNSSRQVAKAQDPPAASSRKMQQPTQDAPSKPVVTKQPSKPKLQPVQIQPTTSQGSTQQPNVSRSVPPQQQQQQVHQQIQQHQVQQPPVVVVSSKKSTSPISGAAAGMMKKLPSKMKLFSSMSPKRKSTKQVMPQQEEGFELKMTDAGPTVVDDFSYHDAAYRAKLTPSEAKTIKMLEDAIELQERRLRVLEESNERALLRKEAKKRLHNGDRKGALYCLAKKKRINQTIDVVKQAVFNMETQIIMLESAIENREVNQIMKEASDAMAAHGNGVRVSDFTDERLGDVLASVGQGDMEYDEEELLSELHETEEGVAADDVDGLLSLPSAPQEPCPIPDELPKKESDAVSKIIASLF